MRLFVLGESRFGARFFRAAGAAGHEICGAAASTPDRDHDPLEAAARSAGVPTYDAAPIVDGWTRPLRASGADLLVLANVSRIVALDAVTACRRGALCFHPSLLPAYRGRRAVRDAVAAGERLTGVTIFRPDAGADTGPVVCQMPVAIDPADTPATLYHDKLVPVGVYLLLAAVAAVAAGCATYSAQS